MRRTRMNEEMKLERKHRGRNRRIDHSTFDGKECRTAMHQCQHQNSSNHLTQRILRSLCSQNSPSMMCLRPRQSNTNHLACQNWHSLCNRRAKKHTGEQGKVILKQQRQITKSENDRASRGNPRVLQCRQRRHWPLTNTTIARLT